MPHLEDEQAQIFQAKVFASGQVLALLGVTALGEIPFAQIFVPVNVLSLEECLLDHQQLRIVPPWHDMLLGFDECFNLRAHHLARWDKDFGIVVDDAGNAYVTSETSSTEASFPVINGPVLTYNSGGCDAFIAKVKDTGAALVYCSYIGGSEADYSLDIAVNGEGDAFVAGITSPTQVSFPVIDGPDLSYNGDTWDAFVAKVSLVPWMHYLTLVVNSD